LLLLFLAASPLHAAYVSATELAKSNGLEYTDMSRGGGHACKLSKNGSEVSLFDNSNIALIDYVPKTLSQPVKWDGSALMIPDEVASLFAKDQPLPKASGKTTAVKASTPVALNVPDRLAGSATVVIDPGHGGKDQGTHSGSLLEKDINLDVAKRLGTYLTNHGVKVIMTRTQDVSLTPAVSGTVELTARTDIANRANPDLFLCIHANSMPQDNLRGAMLLYPTQGVQFRAASRNGRGATVTPEAVGAGGAISPSVQRAAAVIAYESYRTSSIEAAFCLQAALDPITGLYESSGVMESSRNLHVLRETHCPAVIVEMDFLSNQISAKKLATSAYRAQIAEAIGKATVSYLATAVPADTAK
jgi:N-acetylmuramoyl-L-alanine amidase